MRAKQNINGDTLVLTKNTIVYHNSTTGKPYRVMSFPNEEMAKSEFNRETNSYRGCGKNVWRKRPIATIYYSQLIIEPK